MTVAWHLSFACQPAGLIAQILMGASYVMRNLEVLENDIVMKQNRFGQVAE